MRTFLIAAAIALCLIAATPPKFAAVSIHRQAPDDNSLFVKPPANGKFIGTGATAKLMVMLAWDLQDAQIAGGPAWFATDRFVIEANSDDGKAHNAAETREMLQNMLADRFALRTHREMREGTAYVLTVAKSGSKLKQSQTQSTNIRVGANSILLEGAPLSRLAQQLSGILERPVIDRTGLEGTYDASLRWSLVTLQIGRDSSEPGIHFRRAIQDQRRCLTPWSTSAINANRYARPGGHAATRHRQTFT